MPLQARIIPSLAETTNSNTYSIWEDIRISTQMWFDLHKYESYLKQ
jgi:hypothetical protein